MIFKNNFLDLAFNIMNFNASPRRKMLIMNDAVQSIRDEFLQKTEDFKKSLAMKLEGQSNIMAGVVLSQVGKRAKDIFQEFDQVGDRNRKECKNIIDQFFNEAASAVQDCVANPKLEKRVERAKVKYQMTAYDKRQLTDSDLDFMEDHSLHLQPA